MRAVLQRTRGARVEVEGRAVASIGAGLVAFVAVEVGDGPEQVRWMAEPLVHLRLFEGPDGRLSRSVLETGGAVLLVPNFTVAGDCHRGRRPDFTRAAPAARARELFASLAAEVARLGACVAEGRFGAFMRVDVSHDGPVTVVVESRPGWTALGP